MTTNRSCRYEGGMVCFHLSDCTFPSLTACLQHNLYLAQKEISLLKERRNLKHTGISLKWRDSSFYYKKKSRYLEEWIRSKGLETPKIEELFSLEKGETNERIPNSNQEGTPTA